MRTKQHIFTYFLLFVIGILGSNHLTEKTHAIMKETKQLLLLLGLALLSSCKAQPLTPDQWREDIHFFMEQAPKTHIHLYNTLPKSQFDSIGTDLMRRVPTLTNAQITAELVRWVAALGDGHTNLTPPNAHSYPILPFWFKEGFFVVNGQKEGLPWLDWQLEKINNIPVETIVERLRPFQQHDGEQQIRAQAPVFLVSVEALQAVGVVNGVEKALFAFKNTQTGESKSIDLEPYSMANLMRSRHGGGTEPSATALPLYRRKRDTFYWFEWLADSKTLYFQYNTTLDNQHDPIQDFIKKMAEAVAQNPVERFVVDLRWNGGGNLFTSKPFTEFIANNPKINQQGKLFVLLGRHTFSAASYFTSTMEFRTKAIFVGEPTGASPNHYGDTRPIRLPHSGLEPRLSSIYWQNSFAWDKRPATQPDLEVIPTAADWIAKRDAALEAVWHYQAAPKNTLEISLATKKALLGRYLFDGDKLTEIHERNGLLHLSIAGFIETDLYGTPSGNKLASDVRDLYLVPAGQGQFVLEALGGSVVLEKLPDGFMLPKEMLLAGKIAEALEAYRTLKREQPRAHSVREDELNRIGYEFLKDKKMVEALAVFQLNTEFYPEGFNTWDSLAEYYMNAGDKTKAIEYYKQSIALNPNNENGKKMLRQLE